MCGDPILGMSTEFYFTTGPSAAKPYPMRLGIIADLGETANSTQTIEHLLYDKPQFVTLIGDLTCAPTALLRCWLCRSCARMCACRSCPALEALTIQTLQADPASCCADADDITANGEPCQCCKLVAASACWLRCTHGCQHVASCSA